VYVSLGDGFLGRWRRSQEEFLVAFGESSRGLEKNLS